MCHCVGLDDTAGSGRNSTNAFRKLVSADSTSLQQNVFDWSVVSHGALCQIQRPEAADVIEHSLYTICRSVHLSVGLSTVGIVSSMSFSGSGPGRLRATPVEGQAG